MRDGGILIVSYIPILRIAAGMSAAALGKCSNESSLPDPSLSQQPVTFRMVKAPSPELSAEATSRPMQLRAKAMPLLLSSCSKCLISERERSNYTGDSWAFANSRQHFPGVRFCYVGFPFIFGIILVFAGWELQP